MSPPESGIAAEAVERPPRRPDIRVRWRPAHADDVNDKERPRRGSPVERAGCRMKVLF
jgi:hypothetical protein